MHSVHSAVHSAGWGGLMGWVPPEPGDTVVDGAGRKIVHPDGRVTTKRGRTYTWLACDRCGEGSWVAGRAPDRARLAEPDYWKDHGRPCRMTPGCRGRHLLGVADEGRMVL